MAAPRVYTTEAIVLRRTDFGEADRILTIFTPGRGKLGAIAKGIRRTTSRKAGHLEPFMRTQLLLASGRDLEVVTQAEGRERFAHLRADLWHSSAASYTGELVDRFLAEADPHPRLYTHFVETLRRLDDGARTDQQAQSWFALRYFELRLLDALGYRPGLHTCVSCDTPLRPEEHGYSAELGGALCPNCMRLAQRRLSLTALKVLRLLQTTTWEALPRLRMEEPLRSEIESTLHVTLRFHLDRDLKSWPFLRRPAGEHG